MGIEPVEVDLSEIPPDVLMNKMNLSGPIDVLSACPPCTGFSRTMASNHLTDDARNSLVPRTALFVEAFQPKVIVMENARELLRGRWSHHFEILKKNLTSLGYEVHASTHLLTSFGLPQIRERALVIAVADGYGLRTLEDAWRGLTINKTALTVRRALNILENTKDDPSHVAPKFSSETSLKRLQHMPHDGGSWRDLLKSTEGTKYLTPAMKKSAERKDFGSFPDVYGRMAWDKPAPTIKRECSHVGNGRYSHPELDRLCTVREMGILNGFPYDYQFEGSLSNRYRHIGDAVPPLVSYQIAAVCDWILGGVKPSVADLVLPRTQLRIEDIREEEKASESRAA